MAAKFNILNFFLKDEEQFREWLKGSDCGFELWSNSPLSPADDYL